MKIEYKVENLIYINLEERLNKLVEEGWTLDKLSSPVVGEVIVVMKRFVE